MSNEEKMKIIIDLLDEYNVPYTEKIKKHNLKLRFPWCKGDVIMNPYNQYYKDCVESYLFPWDEDYVTRDSPRAMAMRIINYYNDCRA